MSDTYIYENVMNEIVYFAFEKHLRVVFKNLNVKY